MDRTEKPNPSNSKISENEITIIGGTFIFSGDFTGSGAVLITGIIEGNVTADQVVIEESGSIRGNINCLRLDNSGHIRGKVEANDVVTRENGLIEGDVFYASITLEEGSSVIGKLKKTPSKKQAIIATSAKKNLEDGQPNQITHIIFPPELAKKLRAQESLARAYITLIDNSPAPSSINLTEDKMGLLIKHPLPPKNDKESAIRLHVGSDYFDIDISSGE